MLIFLFYAFPFFFFFLYENCLFLRFDQVFFKCLATLGCSHAFQTKAIKSAIRSSLYMGVPCELMGAIIGESGRDTLPI